MPITIGGIEKVQKLEDGALLVDANCFTSEMGVNTSDQYALTFMEFMKIIKNIKSGGYKLQLIIPNKVQELLKGEQHE